MGAFYGDRTRPSYLCRRRPELALPGIRPYPTDGEDDHVHSIGKDVLGLSTERRLDLKAVGHSLQIKLKNTGGTVRLDLRDNSRVVGNPEVVRPRHHGISNGKSASVYERVRFTWTMNALRADVAHRKRGSVTLPRVGDNTSK